MNTHNKNNCSQSQSIGK